MHGLFPMPDIDAVAFGASIPLRREIAMRIGATRRDARPFIKISSLPGAAFGANMLRWLKAQAK